MNWTKVVELIELLIEAKVDAMDSKDVHEAVRLSEIRDMIINKLHELEEKN